MPVTVQVDGVGEVQFPDGMAPEKMRSAIESKFFPDRARASLPSMQSALSGESLAPAAKAAAQGLPEPATVIPNLSQLREAQRTETFSKDLWKPIWESTIQGQLPRTEPKHWEAAGLSPGMAKVASGIQNGLMDASEGVVSLGGLLSLGATGLSKAAQGAVSLAFAADMASGTPELARQAGDAYERKDWATFSQLLTKGGIQAAFVTALGKHGTDAAREFVMNKTGFDLYQEPLGSVAAHEINQAVAETPVQMELADRQAIGATMPGPDALKVEPAKPVKPEIWRDEWFRQSEPPVVMPASEAAKLPIAEPAKLEADLVKTEAPLTAEALKETKAPVPETKPEPVETPASTPEVQAEVKPSSAPVAPVAEAPKAPGGEPSSPSSPALDYTPEEIKQITELKALAKDREFQVKQIDEQLADLEPKYQAALGTKDIVEIGNQRSDLKVRRARLEEERRTADADAFLIRWNKEAAPYRIKPDTASGPKIKSKVLKAQKENLLSQVDDAIKAAPEDGTDKITFDVPGDGSFTISNNKVNLKKFRELAAQKFPVSVATSGGAKSASAKGKSIPAVSEASADEAAKLAGNFTSEDKGRPVINEAYADGTQIVATDGRQLIRIATDKAPGKPEAPVRLSPEGKVSKGWQGKFPDWRQVLGKPDLVYGGMDTDNLWHILQQAVTFRNVSLESKERTTASVQLFVNPDRSVGAKMEINGDLFQHNLQNDAKFLGSYNPEFLLNAVDAARRLGNHKVDVYLESDLGPMTMVGHNHEYVVMPYRGTTGPGGHDIPSAFSSLAGKAEHGRLREGLGPLNSPEALIQDFATVAGHGEYRIELEDGKVKIDQPNKSTPYGAAVGRLKIAEFDLDKWPAGTEKQRKFLKDAGIGLDTAQTAIKDAVNRVRQERLNLIKEAESRKKGSKSSGGVQGGIQGAALPNVRMPSNLPIGMQQPMPPPGSQPVLATKPSVKVAPSLPPYGPGAPPPTVGTSGPMLQPRPGLTYAGVPIVEPKAIDQIIRDLSKGLQVPIRFGRLTRPRLGGYYSAITNLIGAKRANDLLIVGHEVGHRLSEGFGFHRNPALEPELMALGDPALPGSRSSWNPRRSQAYRREEGVAEFTRLWLVDPAEAQRLAPNTHAFFEKALDANKDFGDTLRTAQEDIRVWQNAPNQARFRSHISTSNPNKTPYTIAQLTRDTVDDLHYARMFMDAAKRSGTVPASEDVYLNARNLRGSFGMAETFIKDGVVDFRTKKVMMGTSLEHILHKVSGRLRDFEDYITAKQARELRGQGKETGFMEVDENDIIARFGNDQVFNDTFQKLKDWQDALLQYAVDGGMIRQEQVAAFKKLNADYVPFHRLFEVGAGEESALGASGGTGRGLNLGTPGSLKHRTGSPRPIISPLETIVKNAYVLVTAAEKAAINRSMARQSRRANMGQWIEPVAAPKHKITFGLEKVRQQLEDAGADLDAVPDDMLLDLYQHSHQAPFGENIIRIKTGGLEEFYRVDKRLFETIHALDFEDAGKIVRMASIPAQLLRSGVTSTPDFALFNAIRDAFMAPIISRHFQLPLEATLRGVAALIGKPEMVAEWAASGGKHSVEVNFFDREAIQDYMAKKISKDLTPWERSKIVAGSPLQALRWFSGALEEATRIGEYDIALRNNLKDGMPEGDARRLAAFEARDRQDFSKGGAHTKIIRRLVPFWNAALQGNVRLVQSFKERPLETTLKGIAFITLAKLYEQAVNWDDQSYWDRPRWERYGFFLIPYGKDVSGQTHFVRIPIPFEVGVIFAAAPGAMLDYHHSQNPKAFQDFGQMLLGQTVPNPIPPTVQIMFEDFLSGPKGWDIFRGRQIVPESVATLPPQYQFTEQTSLTARKVGAAMGVSPMKVDHVINQTGGGLAKQIVYNIFDRAIAAGTGEKLPISSGVPGMRFVTSPPGVMSQAVEDFYDNLNMLNADQQAARKVEGFQAKYSSNLVASFDADAKRIADLHKRARTEDDPDEKEQLYIAISQVASGANARLMDYRKENAP